MGEGSPVRPGGFSLSFWCLLSFVPTVMPAAPVAWAVDQLVYITETAVKILQTGIKIAVPSLLPVGLDIFAQLGCSELFPRPCTGEGGGGGGGRDGPGDGGRKGRGGSYGRGLETDLCVQQLSDRWDRSPGKIWDSIKVPACS